MPSLFYCVVGLLTLVLSSPVVVQAAESRDATGPAAQVAAGPPHGQPAGAGNSAKAKPGVTGDGADVGEGGGDQELTPAQKMNRRFPQPARVGHLIGLPVLDDDDSTIGYVRQVVRAPDGKISLIVPYSHWFGWLPVEWGKRPVAVPIEFVVILARQLDSVDMSRDDYDDAATWQPSQGRPLASDDQVLVGLGRR